MLQNTNNVSIKLDFGQLKSTIEWCKRNCTSEWYFSDNDNDSWVFMFESERDYVAFKLWKT
jgi:hypothetical protein